jgi:hypothetical protein
MKRIQQWLVTHVVGLRRVGLGIALAGGLGLGVLIERGQLPADVAHCVLLVGRALSAW